MYGGEGRPKVTKIRIFTNLDHWICGHINQLVLGSHERVGKMFSNGDSIKNNVLSLALEHSDRMLTRVKGRGKAQGGELRDFHG